MRKYLRWILITIILSIIIFEVIIIGIIKIPSGVFHSSYQSIIVDKYRILQEINEPKIIIVAGSSSAFGIDQALLEKETGYKVANLGLHAGFGALFYSELAKENINSGDIVVLAYEYGWPMDDGFNSLDQSLIMSGVDENIDIYKHIPVQQWGDFIGYIFKYAMEKNTYVDVAGIYSREAFDSETAQMTMQRDHTLEYANNEDIYGHVDLYGGDISERSIQYLIKYKEYIEGKGAKVVFASPPVLKDAIACDFDDFITLKSNEIEKIGIPFISNPEDYFFDENLIYDTIYHCTTEGEKCRTWLLINDLKRSGVL